MAKYYAVVLAGRTGIVKGEGFVMPNQTGRQMQRKMLLVLVFAPGVLFMLYWVMFRNNEPEMERVRLPAEHVQLGVSAEMGGHRYMVYGGETVFSERLELKNNTAIAEPGRVFMGLGMRANNVESGYGVEMIDSRGGVYQPLDVDREITAINFGFADEDDQLFMFKVDSKADNFFFMLNHTGDMRAWRVENTLDGR
ncbi:MAG: hypothetical protein MJA84_17445 [Firmicutes bacterium]|nr:hypothetical protein [Bacillota bacterium]